MVRQLEPKDLKKKDSCFGKSTPQNIKNHFLQAFKNVNFP